MTYSILFFSFTLIYISMAIHVLSKGMSETKNRLYFTVAVLFAQWALFNSTLFLITDPYIAATNRRYMVFSWGIVYSVILHLVLNLAGYDKKIKRVYMYLLMYSPALVNILLYFNDAYTPDELHLTNHGWMIENFFRESFLWNNYFYIYYVSSMAMTLFVLASWNRRTKILREKRQSLLMLITFLFAFVMGSILEVILPLQGIEIIYGTTILVALVPISAIAFAIEKYGLMSFRPEVLTLEVLQLMNEGLIICDALGNIEKVNRGAYSILGYDYNDQLGMINDIIPVHMLTSQQEAGQELTITNRKSQKIPVLVNTIPLYDVMKELYGHLIMFQDISELDKIKQELIKSNNELETNVQKRTSELVDVNKALLIEINEKQAAENQIKKMAYYDYLTNLPNPRSFHIEVERRIKEGQRFMVLFIDLDDFKAINDTLGHSKGDQLIMAVSNRLFAVKNVNDFVSRNGGDEFLYLIDMKEEEVFEYQSLEKVLHVFKAPFIINQNELYVSCSIGFSIYPDHGENHETLIKYADIAMYKAKNYSRSSAVMFTESMMEGLNNELRITNDLHKAIEQNQFELYYQPQINSSNGDLLGVEALLRWRHPILGMVSPVEFIYLAENTGMIVPIGEWVIKEAFSQWKKWEEVYGLKLMISINLSIQQMINDQIISYVKNASEELKVDMKFFEFEVTESALMEKSYQTKSALEGLKNLGAKIAIDDFGVAYSSLMHIKEMPISKIKIDKCFIDGIGIFTKDEGIIKTIIALATNLECEIIAEGVETEAQLDFLTLNQCHHVQGYYFSKPLPINQLNEKYMKSLSENLRIN